MKRAFTLIEMVIVIILVGIFAAIVVPNQSQYIDTAKNTAKEAALRSIRNNMALFAANIAADGSYAASIPGTSTTVTVPDSSPDLTKCQNVFKALSGYDAIAGNASTQWIVEFDTPMCQFKAPGSSEVDFTYDLRDNTEQV